MGMAPRIPGGSEYKNFKLLYYTSVTATHSLSFAAGKDAKVVIVTLAHTNDGGSAAPMLNSMKFSPCKSYEFLGRQRMYNGYWKEVYSNAFDVKGITKDTVFTITNGYSSDVAAFTMLVFY